MIFHHHPQLKMYLRILVFLAFSFQGVFSGCPGGWTESDGGCFQVFIQSASLGNVVNARAVCQQQGSDIASLTSSSDATLVAQLIANQTRYAGAASTAYAYIGSSDIATAGAFSWLDGSSSSYSNLSAQSMTQHFIPGDRRCVALHSSDGNWFPNLTNVEWTLVPCCFDIYDVNAVVCSNPNATNANAQPNLVRSYCFGGCPKDWYRLNSTCYYVTDLTRMLNDSTDARQECLSRSADLPNVRSAAEDAHLAYMMREAGKRENASCVSVYQGLNDITTSGSYQYTDKTPATYTSWAPGEPSHSATPDNRTEACATATWTENFNNGTTWKDVSCCTSASVYWLACQRPENGTVAVAPVDNIFAIHCSDVNECLSVPCLNNGTCYNGILRYNCTCLPGYTGTNCETEINYCLSGPCQNNGTCVRHVGYYTCNCVPGTTGTNCETISDYCLSRPCYNNGNCTSLASSFKCDCVAGITGTRCETNIDECFSTPCLNGGTCKDLINGFNCICPTSYTGTRCETKMICEALAYETNNATQRNSSDPNIVTYCCNDERHRFPDMTSCQTVVCKANGWNATIGTCGPHCAQLPFVANANIGNANTAVGNTVNFTCLKGYMLWNNQTSINTTCLPSGNWSEDLTGVTCDVVVCPPLPQWPHQSMDTRNTTYDTTVTFWCEVGYVLYDNTTARTIKCLADATWTADLPPCLPVQCPIVSPQSGVNRNTSTNTYMTYAKYWCNNGLRMLDGSTYRVILCDAGAEWSDTISDCRADRCFPLPYVANATPSATDANHWNTSILTCIKGHRMIFNGQEKSSDVMTCQPNGWWYPILPSCEPILCPKVPTAKNITPNTENCLFETVVTYNCLRGHYIDPTIFSNQLQIECLDTKNWNNTAIPDCTPIHCSAPPDIVNGTRVPAVITDAIYSNMVAYSCDSGTKFLDGRIVKNLRCNETGQWNETDVSCRSDRCNPVNVTAHSTPDTTNTSWYTNVTYRCNPGYEWPNNRVTFTIMCNAGGDWNATFSAANDCTVKSCPDIPLMPNATTNTTEKIFDTVVDYECDVGFKYSDNTTSKTIRCAEDATWQPSVIDKCQIIHCPSLDDVENATRDSNDTYYNKVITYSCLPGYQYPDKLKNKTVTCQANETWTSFPPPCGVVFCPPLPYWTSAIFNTTDNNFLSVVSYTCADGNAFKNNMSKPGNMTVLTSMCLSTKQWVPAIQDCVAVAAINADLVGKSYESPQSVPIGTVACTILCIVLALVILLDLSKIISDLRMLRDNVASVMDNRKKNKVGNSPRS